MILSSEVALFMITSESEVLFYFSVLLKQDEAPDYLSRRRLASLTLAGAVREARLHWHAIRRDPSAMGGYVIYDRAGRCVHRQDSSET